MTKTAKLETALSLSFLLASAFSFASYGYLENQNAREDQRIAALGVSDPELHQAISENAQELDELCGRNVSTMDTCQIEGAKQILQDANNSSHLPWKTPLIPIAALSFVGAGIFNAKRMDKIGFGEKQQIEASPGTPAQG